MVSIRKITEKNGLWYIQGTSEAFDSRVEAIRRAKQLGRVNSEGGKKYLSQLFPMYTFRSTWEVELAETLHKLGIRFEYEPERFYFRAENESYLPDFYLPEYNVWIEVKGWMDKRSLKRVKLFKKHYGKKYGFMLFEREERDLVIVKGMTGVLLQMIEIAQEEHQRVSACQ
ncbi:hypothetical protein HV436_01495 [Bacillus sporothermodurans]|uniref:hypothetical protein n=1 Tax=Heyndrickxia sporothermodurans TaxID=46224 RepID=UPI00192C0E56|nr:hypothetical protein [Heyndrickxia sporothermodurans]MBL5777009.1 hypothetical protein [Heyndrickxia sporothermodurans]MBL5798537.1 hypothetical protein [Heyndrickxia sporothermodurans]MBL5809455.1 hypothetical protein [Heyndrickxia sporothermodurans]MBL5813089.1 hypothetical protein [Heyndrickxia sporothermodurans]MBL5816513.1 hypothetical protein [Heyndrickxia sporothermodurans]